MPATLAEVAGADRDALTELLELEDKRGNRYTLAEPDGGFACPACAMPGCALSVRDPAALQGQLGLRRTPRSVVIIVTARPPKTPGAGTTWAARSDSTVSRDRPWTLSVNFRGLEL